MKRSGNKKPAKKNDDFKPSEDYKNLREENDDPDAYDSTK